MGGERMAKRSIGSLMRKKLSDITNSQVQPKLSIQEEEPLEAFPTEKDCVQQLLKERATLMQLLAERNKIIELSGAELQRLRANVHKLQLQNWNLAQSNSQMLAELNVGRDRIKALQHEVLCKAALLKEKNSEMERKVEMNYKNNGLLSQEGEEEREEPCIRASKSEKAHNRNRRRSIRSQSLGPSTTTTKRAKQEKVRNKRQCVRRHSARFRRGESEPLENLFEIEDAKYPITQSGLNLPSSSMVKDEAVENCGIRNEPPRFSFGRPTRRAAEKIQSYREPSLLSKMRRPE